MSKGLSPFISAALIILIGIFVISLVLMAINPTLNKARDTVVVNEAIQNLRLIDQTIREVVSEGEGSKRTVSLSVSNGVYKVDPNSDSMNFSYRTSSAVPLGIYGAKDNINLTQRGRNMNIFVHYTNIDLRGSGHFPAGDNKVIIIYNGTNSITHKPIIYIERG